jgi:daunorubicin resistance ABC transporter ATP-binding subunit
VALIEVDHLVKVYPGGVAAVDGISFSVAEGEIFGFLGPNGAGKTTTIRVIVTLLAPTSGTVTVRGVDVVTNPELVRRQIGYAAQFIGVDDDLTAWENLTMQARLHGLDRAEAERRSGELLEVLELSGVAGRRAGTFSGGMRRRLDLGQALVHGPRVLFLDEPTTGLDPQTRRALWEYLRELNGRGVTIFLTTQYLEEADALASRLAIIDQGVIAVEGTPSALKRALGGDAITVTLSDDSTPAGIDQAAGVLQRFSDAGDAARYDRSIKIFTTAASSRLAEVVRALDAASIKVARLELSEPTMDDVFLRHTGSRMRVEESKPQSRLRMVGRRR